MSAIRSPSAASPVVDVSSTVVTTHFDSATLASLPGARDFFAIAANTPGVALSKMDVGGNSALSLQEYTAYGLRATTGVNRNEVEGIRVGGANGASDNYLSDFASFSEIAITAVGHTASMPVPGTLGQYVSKSGGNAYHGNLYADFQNEALEATNIDDDQIARGVSGGPGLDARDVNRLQLFRDFNADVGGYLRKDKAWWYARTAPRRSNSDTRGCSTRRPRSRPRSKPARSPTCCPRARSSSAICSTRPFSSRVSSSVSTSQPIETSDALPTQRVLRERVERRVQRRCDRRALRRSARRRVISPTLR